MPASDKSQHDHKTDTQPTPPLTFLEAVLASIATPGASSGLVATVNFSLIALSFLCVLALVTGVLSTASHSSGTSDDSGLSTHFAVLLALSLCLLASFNYFIASTRNGELTAHADIRNETPDMPFGKNPADILATPLPNLPPPPSSSRKLSRQLGNRVL